MATVVLVPMLFSPAGPPPPPAEVSVAAASPDAADVPHRVRGQAVRWDDFDIGVTVAPEPTTTSVPPPTTETTVEATTTTAAPTTTTAPPTTTTTEAPAVEATVTVQLDPETTTTTHTHPPPAPPPPPPSDDGARSQEGQASWYELPGARAGVCAHRTIPKGTVVTVTNLDTGKSIDCTVDDRGPYAEGKIIDLFRDDFARLAPLAHGVFPARITW